MSSRQGDGYKMDKERKVGFENYLINPYIFREIGPYLEQIRFDHLGRGDWRNEQERLLSLPLTVLMSLGSGLVPCACVELYNPRRTELTW